MLNLLFLATQCHKSLNDKDKDKGTWSLLWDIVHFNILAHLGNYEKLRVGFSHKRMLKYTLTLICKKIWICMFSFHFMTLKGLHMQWAENLKHVFWLLEFKAKEVKRNLAIVK